MELYYLMDNDGYYRSAITLVGGVWESKNKKENDAVIYTPKQLQHAMTYYKRKRIRVTKVLVQKKTKVRRKSREKKQNETI